jgi:hypothetical protein
MEFGTSLSLTNDNTPRLRFIPAAPIVEYDSHSLSPPGFTGRIVVLPGKPPSETS